MNSNYVVTLGHAVGGEKGKTGNKAGNQTGNELRFQAWYNRSKGWNCVLRCKNEALRQLIARDAIEGVRNKNIGYDQADRYTLWNLTRPSYDCLLANKPCECDCSTFVANCVAYAGIQDFQIKDFYTGNMMARLTATKAFKIFTTSKYLTDYKKLIPGDILIGEGHTAIVVNNVYWLKSSLSKAAKTSLINRSADIRALQSRLNELGYSLDVDGKWGALTESAVRDFQAKSGLEVDGIVGKSSAAALGFLYGL